MENKKEDMDMARIELNDQQMDDVVGGNFNWYKERGTYLARCRVTGLGDYYCSPSAKSRYNALKLEHKLDGWTEQDYVNALVSEGEFSTNPF